MLSFPFLLSMKNKGVNQMAFTPFALLFTFSNKLIIQILFVINIPLFIENTLQFKVKWNRNMIGHEHFSHNLLQDTIQIILRSCILANFPCTLKISQICYMKNCFFTNFGHEYLTTISNQKFEDKCNLLNRWITVTFVFRCFSFMFPA